MNNPATPATARLPRRRALAAAATAGAATLRRRMTSSHRLIYRLAADHGTRLGRRLLNFLYI